MKLELKTTSCLKVLPFPFILQIQLERKFSFEFLLDKMWENILQHYSK